jgi:selenide,water dikinase
LSDWVTYEDIDEPSQLVVCDAQTSGGLLFALPEVDAPALVRALEARGTACAAIVGRVEAGGAGKMRVISKRPKMDAPR